MLEEIDAALEHRLRVISMISGRESLRAGRTEKRVRWIELFSPIVEERLPSGSARH